MKILKILVPLSLIFFVFSCDLIEDLFESDDPKGSGSIIGSWLESDATFSLSIITSSTQIANNFLNSTGAINVTGGLNTELPLLLYIRADADLETQDEIYVTATTGLFGDSDTTYILYINPNDPNEEGQFLVNSDVADLHINLKNLIPFIYDGSTFTITNTVLTQEGVAITANIEGTIVVPQVNIPPATPTTLSFDSNQFYEFGSTVTTFEEDSTFTSSEDTGLGDSTGTWLVSGDTLKITTAQEVEDITTGEISYVDTTWIFNYVNTGDQFVLSQTIPVCDFADNSGDDDDLSCEELYQIIELFFGLDKGSITDAQLIYQLFFERTNNGALIKVGASNAVNELSNPQKIINFMINTRNRMELDY